MRIVVTGVAGVLGGRVAAGLAGRHEVRGVDVVEPADPPVPTVVADLADYEAARAALADAEVVVHCAAIHPWKPYTEEQYLHCNVIASYQVARACADLKVSWLVFTSSIAAKGYPTHYPPAELPIAEDAPVRNVDVYSHTKTLGEETMRYWNRRAGTPTWILRPPTFIPFDDDRRRVAMMFAGTWVAPEDIAAAHILAAEVRPDGVETAFLPQETPYTADDIAEAQAGGAEAVLERHFPGVAAWFRAEGLDLPVPQPFFDGTTAPTRLGWRPQWTPAKWWAEHSEAAR
ncbi:MAG: NAD(P)-dependent oxidoreductase [Armatimonadetes bacterium]|nr:NAD(P)-dependent oxidoreductase [Armatimonadota bacterium]